LSKQAVFLDRDGTLIEEVGHLYRFDDMQIYPAALQAVARINRSGALAVVITNQSAVARGLLSEADLQHVHRLMNEAFGRNGARIDAFYYCPHHPGSGEGPYSRVCSCRKPKPGLLLRAAQQLDIELRASYMLGDRLVDVQTGHRAGCKSILLRTGYGAREVASIEDTTTVDRGALDDLGRPEHIADNVLEGVKWILEQRFEERPESH
jgi:D-glycero-D-manno-heptose 1,7-bisphosphate phosphatase